jgi:hypothetical protein
MSCAASCSVFACKWPVIVMMAIPSTRAKRAGRAADRVAATALTSLFIVLLLVVTPDDMIVSPLPGRSPGSRVVAYACLPSPFGGKWRSDKSSPLTVAGAAPDQDTTYLASLLHSLFRSPKGHQARSVMRIPQVDARQFKGSMRFERILSGHYSIPDTSWPNED